MELRVGQAVTHKERHSLSCGVVQHIIQVAVVKKRQDVMLDNFINFREVHDDAAMIQRSRHSHLKAVRVTM